MPGETNNIKANNIKAKVWIEVIKEDITEIKRDTKENSTKLDMLNTDFQVFKREMKIKSGLWGALSGGIGGTLISILTKILNLFR
jgi:DNA-binding ferritin-like protein (Dps family)